MKDLKCNKILYVFPAISTFIEKDIEMLSFKYIVIRSTNNWKNKWIIVFELIRQFHFVLFKIRKVKAVIVMFGGYWSLFPVLIGKFYKIPVYIILGGTDCVSYPTINYGSLRKPILRFFIKHTLVNCTKILPVDDSLIYSENEYLNELKSRYQGFMHHFPALKTKYEVIYNGYDPDNYFYRTEKKVKKTFLSIAYINDETRMKLKGIDLILILASVFKDFKFIVVGMDNELKKRIGVIPSNLLFYPSLSQKELKPFIEESQFYLQLSISEGFPNALCEAMLSGCIPIGSNVAAIPKIIGNCGFIIEKSDPEFVVKRIKEILEFNIDGLGEKSRNQISSKFHINIRKEKLYNLIN